MSNTEAVQHFEFPCQKCGAKLTFDAGVEALKCQYCNHVQDVEKPHNKPIVEHDFKSALAQVRTHDPKQTLPGGKELQCEACGAVSVLKHESGECAFCGSPLVLNVEVSDAAIVPESLLPFKVDDKTATGSFMKWLSSRWFAPGDLAARARKRGMDGVYLPYWTYDSNTTTQYVGRRGQWYYVKEKDSQGNEREVRKTRWYPASGSVRVNFDDVLVFAGKGLPRNLVEKLEPWDLHDLRPWEASYLSGYITERYQVDLEEGFGLAEDRMEPEIRSAIRQDIGGDEQQILSMNIHHANVKFKHFLLPLWLSSFRYGEKVYRVMVNARTGEVSGERPYSVIKIIAAIVLGVGVIAGGYFLFKYLGG